MDDGLRDELDSYLEHEIALNLARGMTPEAARRAALRKLGNRTAIHEEVHEMRRIAWRESLMRDARQGLRQARRHPGFAAGATALLALGIASTSAIFSLAYGVLLRDLPYPRADRLIAIQGSLPHAGMPTALMGLADYFDYRRHQQVFTEMALTRAVGNYNLTGVGEPERLLGARTTASLFAALGVAPALGRTFTEAEQLDPSQAGRVAVLSHALWQRRFGSDAAIVGRRIMLNGAPNEVLGVMGPDFRYPSREFELWTPLYVPPAALADRGDYSYLSVGRLKDGVKVEAARAHLESLAARLARDYPRQNRQVGVVVTPLLAQMTGGVRGSVWLLAAASTALFLIACVNLANLLLARAAGRSRELAVRASLGASRPRLARQFFAEALPLTIAGLIIGVLAAHALLRTLIPWLPATMPRVEEIGLHWPAVAVAAGASALATLLIALAPAVTARAGVERGPRGLVTLRDTMMVAQIAGTAVLLVAAGLLMRSFLNVSDVHPGFETRSAWAMHLAVSRAKYGEDPGVARYLGQLERQLRTLPGVEAVGLVNRLPMMPLGQQLAIRFEHEPDTIAMVDSRSINGGYFRSLGIPLVAGRTFDDATDGVQRPAVGIVDERIVREAFGGRSPLGKRFRIDAAGMPWVEVVGVAGHLRTQHLESDLRPQVYWPYRQRTQDRMAIVVRGQGSGLVAAAREAVRQVDPDQPLHDVRSMDEVVDRTLSGRKLDTVLVMAFAAMALLLAAAGLYSVVAFLTAQRQREFALRTAVGATPMRIASLVLGHGARRAALGLAIGLGAPLGLTRLLSAMLHGVEPADPATYACAAAVLMSVTLIAVSIPARRAARTDPAVTLRSE